MIGERSWYVVLKEPEEGDNHVDVFGPFVNETDAKSYVIDVGSDDDGWETIEAVELTHDQAEERSTDGMVYWPYENRPAPQ